ncbi:MBL fold metallo-hydrolase [Halorussus halophilus]|uniref:mRNA cleavage and polyadenylation specificity factor-like protein n=1 Tax=Halorussus halophilus TaxID=2650975 RepID=UPI001300CB4E|nr:mRNA cleavage and polyadenylation specificity factor-like protein [Halorussus halophilus]
MAVRRKDGIHVDLGAGRTVVADASSAVGDVNVVSHAHADHTFRRTPETVVCSAETAAIVEVRTGAAVPKFSEGTDEITLLPSGHVVGSRAALVETTCSSDSEVSKSPHVRESGGRGRPTRVLYTGDFSVRDRCYLEGFEPVDADVLVMETTYGNPAYRFPPEAELQNQIRDWLRDHDDRPLFLFGYSLGRAQKLQWLAREATNRPLVVYDSIRRVNDAIESATDLDFPAETYSEADGLAGDEIVVLPSHFARREWVEKLVTRHDGLKVGFSGWAVEESFRYRGGYDETFPLTDHCDYDELISVVEAVDPDVVYTHHGFDTEFADTLQTEFDRDARAFLGDQTRLDDF